MNDNEESPEDVRDEILRLIETRGLRAAAMAAIDVCEDKKAPAPARATASGLLLRVAELGGFGKGSERAGRQKEPHEMDGLELAAATEEARRNLARLRAEKVRAADDDGGGAFA